MQHPPIRPSRLRAVRRSLLATAIAASAGLVVLGPSDPVVAATSDFATPVFSADARGDLTTIGNIATTCDPAYENEHWSADESAAACIGATSGGTGLVNHAGAPLRPINNRLSMIDVDVDDDPTTFNSSRARLRVPDGAVVLWAGLHWNAATEAQLDTELYGSTHHLTARTPADRFQVRFATPSSGGYVDLEATPGGGTTSDGWDDVNPGGTVSYAGYVDVTDHVAAGGSGDYVVANVQTCRGFGGCFGSWSMTVAFAHPDEPARNLNVWHGWRLTTPSVDGGAQQFTVEGLTPPPSGPVRARIGVVQADGDRGLGPDSLDISSPSSPAWTTLQTVDRPLHPDEGDWFNSTVNAFGQRRPDTDAEPNLLTNLHQDIALVEDDQVIGNDDTAFSFRIQTASTESLYSQVVHSAVELYEPEVAIDKSVDPAGPVPLGDEVTWTLEVTNAGIDPIRRAVVTDPLPDGVTYVPGSIAYAAGGPASLLGAKTDGPGDDEAEYDEATRTLTFRIGAGATESEGGTMAIAPADDGSDRTTITFRTVVEAPPGTTVPNTARADGEGRALADPFGPITTTAEDDAQIATLDDPDPDPDPEPEPEQEIDLGIAKTDGDAVIRAIGDRYRYRLEVTNGGPDDATGVRIDDELDDRIRFSSSEDGCTAIGRAVTCPIGDLAAGASTVRSFEVEVLELPAPGEVIPNIAVVRGDQPDPDCVPPTPEARCNRDDETTPRVDDPPPPETTTSTTAPSSTTTPARVEADGPAAPPGPTGPRTLRRTGSSSLQVVAVGAALIALGAWVLELRARRVPS